MSKWTGDDLWNLQLPLSDLKVIYPYETINYLRTIKAYHLKKGIPVERSEPYLTPEIEQGRAASRKRVASATGDMVIGSLVSPQDRARYHDLLDRALDEQGHVSRATFRDWEMGSKDKEGNPQVTALHGVRFDVKFDSEPAWPVVNRVESAVLPKKESKKAAGVSKTAIILPDLQIPFQDDKAVSIALQILRDSKPDKVIILGDMLDLSAWSKYEQRPEYATATQGAINQAHQLLVSIRKLAPSAEIIVMAGNHEKRMETALLRNAQAAYGLRRADQPEGWPVLSVPYLCAFDQLGVQYIDGYPASRYWINERLQVRHGSIARPGGKTAVAVANDERVSTIFGHIHRIESQYKTVNVYGGGRTSAAYSIGALCRIDGHVPSTKSAHDLAGQPVENYENWQHGCAKVGYLDGDNAFSVEPIYINTFNGYETHHNGKIYTP